MHFKISNIIGTAQSKGNVMQIWAVGFSSVYWLDFFTAFRCGDELTPLTPLTKESIVRIFFSIFITSFYQSLISQCNTGLQAATTVRSTTGGLQTHHLLRLSNYLAFYYWMCSWWMALGESNICFFTRKVCWRRMKSSWVLGEECSEPDCSKSTGTVTLSNSILSQL